MLVCGSSAYQLRRPSTHIGSFVRELAITSEPREVCVGCCVYDAVTAEANLESHGVRPGSGLKTLGREETGLRI
jgi:hypothetical protein